MLWNKDVSKMTKFLYNCLNYCHCIAHGVTRCSYLLFELMIIKELFHSKFYDSLTISICQRIIIVGVPGTQNKCTILFEMDISSIHKPYS